MVWPWKTNRLGLQGGAGPAYQSSCFFSACGVQSECWSFRPSAHPGRTEGKGRGRAEGGVLPVEPKVKGCHGPANGDEELTLNLTLPVRGETCSLDGCTVYFCSKDRSPLLLICLSVCRSSSLSLSPSHSFSHSPALPSVCDLDTGSGGDASPLGERNQCREGGRVREEVHTSLFYGTQPGPALGAVPHLEVRAVEKWSQRVQQSKRSCPETLLQPGDTDRDTDREGGSVLHWANTQKWLLNLCPPSALSASSQGLSIQLLPPGLGNSNSRCWK